MKLPEKMPKIPPFWLGVLVLVSLGVVAVVIWLIVKLILYITILLCVFGLFDFLIKRKELEIERLESLPKVNGTRRPFKKINLNF
jgi:hypothetical protein